jgi:hypothetical protein
VSLRITTPQAILTASNSNSGSSNPFGATATFGGGGFGQQQAMTSNTFSFGNTMNTNPPFGATPAVTTGGSQAAPVSWPNPSCTVSVSADSTHRIIGTISATMGVHEVEVPGDTLYYQAAHSGMAISAGISATQHKVPVHVYATIPASQSEAEVTDARQETALALLALLLESDEVRLSSPDGQGSLIMKDCVPWALHLLRLLPFVGMPASAASMTRTIAGLLRRWVVIGRAFGGHDAVSDADAMELISFFQKLRRAHSWLRTQLLAQWTKSVTLPSHIQQMMDL